MVSDVESGLIAGGWKQLGALRPSGTTQWLTELVQEYEVATLVVGYPKNMNGGRWASGRTAASNCRTPGAPFPSGRLCLG